MPHNLFLHSALVISRKIPQSFHGIKNACRCFLIESGFALFIAFLINVAVVSVSGTICSSPDISPQDKARCSDITLNSAPFLLKNVLGKWSSKIFAISLLASGQSSTVTGTYAGQYIMQGFLDLKMEIHLRNIITRSIAITPSLVVSIIGGSSGAGKLIIVASMILSFELPFALIPLLKFTSSGTRIGLHKNSIAVSIISWLLGMCLIGVNMYYLSTALMGWLFRNHLPKAASVFTATLVFPMMMVYLALLIYLMLRKEEADTVSEDQIQIESTSHEQEDSMKSEDIETVKLPE